MKIGFDNEKYLFTQSQHIRERISQFGDKLYLEFGGKLFDDFHASRVLPGFAPDSKLQMLLQLADQAELIIVISASDIEKNKMRHDFGITYDVDVLRLIEAYTATGPLRGERRSSPSIPARPAPMSSSPSWSTWASAYTATTPSTATPAMWL